MFDPTPEHDPPSYNSPGDVTLPHDAVIESSYRDVDPNTVPAFFDTICAGNVERVLLLDVNLMFAQMPLPWR